MGDSMLSIKMGDEGKDKNHYQSNKNTEDEIAIVANTLAAIGDNISEIYGSGEEGNARAWLRIGIPQCAEIANALIYGFFLWQEFDGGRKESALPQREACNGNKMSCRELSRRMNLQNKDW